MNFFGTLTRRKLIGRLVASEFAFLSSCSESSRPFSNSSKFLSTLDQEANGKQKEESDVVTPWYVKSGNPNGVDYGKFLENFELKGLNRKLVERIEELTGKKAHPMLRRGLFYAHRNLEKVLDRFERKKPFFLYTGRGPSSGSLHLGHLVPFIFVKYLQESFDVPLIVQVTDDEKFLWNAHMRLEEARMMAKGNVKDIISVGFDPNKTFVFTNSEYMCPALYANVLRIWKATSLVRTQSIFGFSKNDSVGKCAFPALEVAPCFSSSFPEIFNSRADIPCLIPCAIDQDPYFRMAGDIAPHLRYQEPATMYTKFLPALQGIQGKMSASEPNSCIFIDDTPNQIKNKINKHGFSGGRETVELHRELGGNCQVDVSFQFLQFFLDDDDELEKIRRKYSSGDMLTGELKKKAIQVLQEVVSEFQERRKKVTDETVVEFTKVRKLAFDY